MIYENGKTRTKKRSDHCFTTCKKNAAINICIEVP